MERAKLLDGSTGAFLLSKVPGLKSTELANLTNPGAVSEIHRAYVASGCNVVSANTFSANALNAAKYGYDLAQLIQTALSLVKEAAADSDALTALDIGATGKVLGDDPDELTPERAYKIYSEIIDAALSVPENVPDWVWIETMSSIEEAFIAFTAVRAKCKLPILVTMSFAESGRTMYGAAPEDFAAKFEATDAAAIGMNCFVTPDKGYAIFERLKASSTKPLVVQPNGSATFAADMRRYLTLGASYVGGCCGTTPEDIAALRKVINDTTS